LAEVSAMGEDESPERLKSLGERLEAARRQGRPAQRPVGTGDRSILSAALGLGMRFGIELVVAVGVGFFIGWAIDRGLGTRPWFMVAFLVLGAAAGILNAWRSMTGQGSAVGFRRAPRAKQKSGEE
jgi:ATP synthase protein I